MLYQILYIFQFTCLKLIVNYCIKHGALYVNDLYIHWATNYILSWTTKKHQKIPSRLLHSKLKKIQALFKDLHRNLRTFRGKMEFKDFSRTSPKIQGLFKTVRTLLPNPHKTQTWKGENKLVCSRQHLILQLLLIIATLIWQARIGCSGNGLIDVKEKHKILNCFWQCRSCVIRNCNKANQLEIEMH